MAMEIAEKRDIKSSTIGNRDRGGTLKVAPMAMEIAEKRDIKSSTIGNRDRGENGH